MESQTSALEQRLDELLAPWAMLHRYSGGRLFLEPPHGLRSCYQRDRDRIIHSKAFRRLGYKTQVFINSAGDNYRTRLTHSLEVAQVSRAVCSALQLNPDFAETLALAHDLGHTPFGHSGQDVLNRLMRDHGGFEHNCQSLRLVSHLEQRYLEFDGLNLTRSALKGMLKRPIIYDCDASLAPLRDERARENPALEAAIVDACDRIAYIHHDLEDGLDAALLDLEELNALPAWRESWHATAQANGERFQRARLPLRIRTVIRAMMNQAIGDLIETTRGRLAEQAPRDLAEVLHADHAEYPVAYSREMRERLAELQKFLFQRLYRCSRVMQMSRRGERIVEFLFGEYAAHPALMPDHYQERIELIGLYRVVSDYLSGMTDRFADRQFAWLSGRDTDRI